MSKVLIRIRLIQYLPKVGWDTFARAFLYQFYKPFPLFLQYLNQTQLSWVDRSGVQHSLSTLGNNSCDAKSPTMMTDIGEIDDMTKLPLFKIIYGPLHESAQMVINVGRLECTPKGEDQRYSLKRHVLDLESRIGENNITISNVDEECKQELEEQKTTIEQITTQDEKQQNLLNEQKTKIDQLSSNSEQHQGELQRLSLENVAEVKKLAEQKSLLDEHKSELDQLKS